MTISNKFLALTLILAFTFVLGANAQTRRRKSKARRTTPVVRTKTTSTPALDAEVVSRAEDDLKAENGATAGRNGAINPDLPKTQASRPAKTGVAPSDKVNPAAEKEDRSLVDLERLSLAEGRAEAFRKQLSDVVEREANLRSKIEQLDYQMRPEVIQGETATIGSLRPEEVRESRRKMLENEKTRTSEQLTRILESRTRLESAIVNADALVDKLRARVEAESNEDTRKSTEKITSKDSSDPQLPEN